MSLIELSWTAKKHINCDIFGKKLRMEDVLSVLLYPNTNYLHLLLSEPKKFTRVLFVTFVTNSTSGANNTIDNNILVV